MACPYCTWENLTPPPTTWLDFAYSAEQERWLTWNEIFQLSLRSSCTRIEVDTCRESSQGVALPTIYSYHESSGLETIRLFEENIPANLTSIAWMMLRLDTGVELYSYVYPSIFTWSVSEEEPGYVFLRLGEINLGTRVYFSDLIIKDMTISTPLYWNKLRIVAESKVAGESLY